MTTVDRIKQRVQNREWLDHHGDKVFETLDPNDCYIVITECPPKDIKAFSTKKKATQFIAKLDPEVRDVAVMKYRFNSIVML